MIRPAAIVSGGDSQKDHPQPMAALKYRPWQLDPSSRQLRIGEQRLSLADVADFSAGETYEPNVAGHLLAVTVFMGAGAMFVILVATTLAAPKFLIAAGLLLAIGASAFGEVTRSRCMHVHWVDIRLKNGATVRFTSDSPAETQALSVVLRSNRR